MDHLSPSSLSQLLQCGESWRLERVEKVARPVSISLLVGGALHTAVEKYWVTLRDQKVAMSHGAFTDIAYQTLAESYLGDREIIIPDGEDRKEVLQGGLDKVRRLATVFMDEVVPQVVREGVPFLVEHEVRIEPADPGLPPIVTRIDWEVGGWIYDLKTTAKLWSEDDIRDDDQFTAYWLAAQVDGRTIKGLRIVFIVDTKTPKAVVVETTRTDAEVMCLLSKYESAWAAIRAGVFIPAAKGWWCSRKYCGFAYSGKCKFFPKR